MVLNNIEELLEKYNNAETTLQEEAQLRAYFTSEDVAPHLEHYKPMFLYFSQSQKEQYTKDVPLKSNRTKLYQWISVAAVAVLMLGFMIPQIWNSKPVDPWSKYTVEEKQMYLEAKEALAMLSNNFSDGVSSINTLNVASENFNIGLENVSHINTLSKTTNKLLKN
jgi:hypothetical protein